MDTWLLLVVMSLATYRGTKLIVEDTFPPVLWVRDRLVGGWRPLTLKESETNRLPVLEEGQSATVAGLGGLTVIDGEVYRFAQRWRRSPFWLAELISCPWCASGWVAAVVTVAVWATAGLALPLLWWGAVWAVGALLAGQEWA